MSLESHLPEVDFSDISCGMETQFQADLHQAWSETGFVSEVNYDPPLMSLGFRPIAQIWADLLDASHEFFALPLEEKMKYTFPELAGQFGYVPHGIEQSGGGLFREFREHFMVGQELAEDHPIALLHSPLGLNFRNKEVSVVPRLIPLAEELGRAREELDLIVYEQVALHHGWPKGKIAQLMVYGNSKVRLHFYPRIEQNILAEENIENVPTLTIQDTQLSAGPLRGVVRAGKHTDIDMSAALFGANRKGLLIFDRQGQPHEYTSLPGCIVNNCGDYIEHMTFRGFHEDGLVDSVYPSSPHAVGLTRETAATDRISVVRFGHPRLRAPVQILDPRYRTPENLMVRPDSCDGVLLYQRLWEIGYGTKADRDKRFRQVLFDAPSDSHLVDKIVAWEAKHGVDRLSRYSRLV